MTWSQILLLGAILVVFLLWRRARSQVTLMRDEIERHRARNTFTFEASVEGPRRLVIRDVEGAEVSTDTLTWSEHGLEAFAAYAQSAAVEALAPGTRVELIPDDGVVTVWSRDMTRRLATVGAEDTAAVLRRLDEAEIGSCVLLAEAPASGPLMFILIHAGVDVES